MRLEQLSFIRCYRSLRRRKEAAEMLLLETFELFKGFNQFNNLQCGLNDQCFCHERKSVSYVPYALGVEVILCCLAWEEHAFECKVAVGELTKDLVLNI